MKIYHYALGAVLACAVMVTGCVKESWHYCPVHYYTVIMTTSGGGTTTASRVATEGVDITLSATPSEGYAFNRWTVTAGGAVLEDALANPATFTMPAENVTVQAEFAVVGSHDDAVYHEGVGAWIVPQNDPYELANFRQARENLIARGYTRADEVPETLEATHFALKIRPRNEEEQWAIDLLEDVEVAYIPFDYTGLTEAESKELETAATRAGERPTFDEVSTHFEDDDFVCMVSEVEISEEGGEKTESVSQIMPIVYAVWPVDKPLPEEFDYEQDYQIYLPAAARTRGDGASAEAMRALEEEAIALALGRPSRRGATRAGGTRAGTLSGEFEMWESLSEIRVPIPRVRVKFNLGSNIVETDADSDGYFSVDAASVPDDASWNIVFQNEKWKVTRAGSTVPKNFFQGNVYQPAFWSDANTHIRTTVQPTDATIINALNHYYYSTHPMSKFEISGGIRVISPNESSSVYNGMFSYSSSGSCYITIYRNNSVNRNKLTGTVLHELGHFIHFKERGGYSGMRATDKLIQESYASYVGWFLTDEYYKQLEYIQTSNEDISGQGRQTWRTTTGKTMGYYSPLFVDLLDTYNQGAASSSYNRDDIKSEKFHTYINRIAKECTSWEQCTGILRSQSTDSSQSWDDFLKPYNEWYGRNP